MISNPGQYYEMYYGALNNYFLGRGLSTNDAYQQTMAHMTAYDDYGLGYNVYSLPNGEYLIGENGKLNPNATLGNLINVDGQQFLVRPDKWIDEAYRNSLRQEYNVSITAGNDKSSFYASVNYLNNEGITANSDYERLTGRLRADYQVKEWLKVGANMAYTHYEANSLNEDGSSGSSGNVFAIATQIAPIYPLFYVTAAVISCKTQTVSFGMTLVKVKMQDWGVPFISVQMPLLSPALILTMAKVTP